MKKLLGFLIGFMLIFTLGYWASEKKVLEGTKVGDILSEIVTHIPVPKSLHSSSDSSVKEADFTTEAFKQKLNGTLKSTDAPSDEDAQATEYERIENRIFEKLNELRREKNVTELKKNPILKEAADVRAVETEQSFSHTRPNGEEPFTVLNEPAHTYEYRLAGENLGMATYVFSEEEMADLIFKGWMESEGHYENMINPDFREIGIGVHDDGENLYLTQLFGTPFSY